MERADLGNNGCSTINNRIPGKAPFARIRGRREEVVPLRITNLQVDYDDGLWSVSLSLLDAVGCSQDFREARQKLFEYIDFLWNEYVLCPEQELGETGKMQRDLLLELFSLS